MSMIGDFGLCTKNNYNSLVTAIKNDQFDIAEDYAMTVFTEKEKLQFLSLANQIDYEQVTQYINDFYQNDYGDIG